MTHARRTVLILGTMLTCTVGGAASSRASMLTAPSPREVKKEIVAQLAPAEQEEVQAVPDSANPGQPIESLPTEQSTPSQPAQRAKIEELLELTNADALNVQILEQMIAQFRLMSPEVPDEWWNRFTAKALETDINSLLIPIYERNYTAEEIDGLIEFYQSPLGQSLLAKAPIVTQESIAVGQAWGLQMVEELIGELEADGYEFPTQLPVSPASPPEAAPQPE